MSISALVQINFDLLLVGVSVAGIALLGFIIYFNDRQSATNRAFFFFALWNVIWSISNYFEYRFMTTLATLWALRFHLFLSTWYAFFFFRLAYVFPREKIVFPRWYRFGFIPLIIVTSIFTLTPLVFSGLDPLALPGQVTRGIPGPGIILFMLVAFGALISGLVTLFGRMQRIIGIERRQTQILFLGMFLTAILILTFNVILPNVFSNRGFIPLAALFLFPLIAFTFYAIYRHHLFNLKVATTAFMGFMVTIFSFVNILYSSNASGVAINVTAFLIVLLGSIKIVQDTLSLKRLTEELSETNSRQETLIHFIGHEVKGFLTKAEGALAELVEGDFGALSDPAKNFAERALVETRQGVDSVSNILKASNLKKGTVTYTKEPFDMNELVAGVIEKAKPVAEKKGLTLSYIAEDAEYQVVGDKEQINTHVLRNLIDNAINYTPTGSITVSLKKENGKIVFAVKDSGIGITEEDKQRLFTEGGHGKDSEKVNVHSTGYGLYIAKQVTEAMGGTIRAESLGAGKGSTFIAEFLAG